MSDNDFPQMLKAFVFITIFAFLMLGFAVTLGNQYNNPEVEEFSEQTNYQYINSTVSGFEATAQGWQNSFYGQSIFSTIAGIIVTGMFSLAKGMFNFIMIPFGILKLFFINILHLPLIVPVLVYITLILSALFGIWRLIKIGQ